jgi:SAM-dependent methyltransferase
MDVDAGAFDTVLMMMNGIGLAETLSGLQRFFREAGRLLRPGGQIIADSTDVRVRMDPEAARTGILRRPDGRYIGELHFQLEFEGRKGDPFRQLYVDSQTLGRYARRAGWSCEIVLPPDEYGHYLARLNP